MVNGHGEICLFRCVARAARIVYYVLRFLLLALLRHLRCNLGFRQLPAAFVPLHKPLHLQSDLILSQSEKQCCTFYKCMVHSDVESNNVYRRGLHHDSHIRGCAITCSVLCCSWQELGRTCTAGSLVTRSLGHVSM